MVVDSQEKAHTHIYQDVSVLHANFIWFSSVFVQALQFSPTGVSCKFTQSQFTNILLFFFSQSQTSVGLKVTFNAVKILEGFDSMSSKSMKNLRRISSIKHFIMLYIYVYIWKYFLQFDDFLSDSSEDNSSWGVTVALFFPINICLVILIADRNKFFLSTQNVSVLYEEKWKKRFTIQTTKAACSNS